MVKNPKNINTGSPEKLETDTQPLKKEFSPTDPWKQNISNNMKAKKKSQKPYDRSNWNRYKPTKHTKLKA